jgi:methylphosphotriester-DNA--protein-cysteine methyltransferase
VGVTPKLYARIQRFRRALELINQGSDPLVDVACPPATTISRT